MGFFGPNVEKMERNRDVAGLIKALNHKDINVQNKAHSALVRIGAPAVEPLINALKDKNRNIRLSAVEALGKIGDTKAVEPLIQALMDEDSVVRRNVRRALGRIGDARAVEPLAQDLRDKSSYVRWEAAESLDLLGWKPRNDVEKANYLIAKLSWGELVILGEPSNEPLMQALKDDDELVREAAEEALEKIKTNTLAKTPMTKKLVHVVILTEKALEANDANIAGCVAAAFPEELEIVDPAAGRFTLRDGAKEFRYTLSTYESSWKDNEIKGLFRSWVKSVEKGVHDLPLKREVSKTLIAGSGFGPMGISALLEKINPEFATSTAFIRKWSVIAGETLVIGVYSVVPQEV